MSEKKITTVLFDLDGTLLPMDQDVFAKTYFTAIGKDLVPLGYDLESVIKGIWTGTRAMMKNDGAKTNEAVFWETFAGIFGERVYGEKPVFDAFYEERFDNIASVCGYDPRAALAVKLCREKGLTTALATNPIFPRIATQKRMKWAGLSSDDFALYTTYENARYCKPDANYYMGILEALEVSPESCLMVGNDVTEDMAAAELGMAVFLLTPCMINKNGSDISRYPQGGFDELLTFIRAL